LASPTGASLWSGLRLLNPNTGTCKKHRNRFRYRKSLKSKMLSRVTGTPEGGKGGRGERRGRPERLRAREFRVPVTRREACRKQRKSDRNGFRPSPGSSGSKSIKFSQIMKFMASKIWSLRVRGHSGWPGNTELGIPSFLGSPSMTPNRILAFRTTKR
jgi:hypothetical protein